MDKLYFTLEPAMDREILLPKRINESYLGKTFDEVIQYMLEEEGDEMNKPYNSAERYAVAKINDWIVQKNAGKIGIGLEAQINDQETISVEFEDKLSDYSDRIILDETNEETSTPYNRIHVQIATAFINGGNG